MKLEEALEIVDRWRTNITFSPPEMEDFRWYLIAQELHDLVSQASEQSEDT